MSSPPETQDTESSQNQPYESTSHPMREEDNDDPQVEFCNLARRNLQRPSDHYNPPPRRTHIASRILREPWTTALTQFSKVTNLVLNPYEEYEGPTMADIRNTLRDPLGYVRQREEGATYGHHQMSNPAPMNHPPPALPPIDCSIPQQRVPPLTAEEYNQKYANAPRRVLLERIFQGGIQSNKLRRILWPTILCITEKYSLDWKDLNLVYTYYSNQWKTILPDQEARFTAYRERKSLIDRDVVRCDRTHSFYSESNPGNVEKLRQLLMTYIMYDFDTGYVQGMTDLAAPLLYVWDGDIPKAFWCFVQVMKLCKRNFEMSQLAIKNQLKALIKLVQITDPVFAQHLCSNESANCYFAFRWIICLFKREFMKRKTDDYHDCLIVWETIWSIHSLASLDDEDKQDMFLDQSLSPLLNQIGAIKRQYWSHEADNSDNSSNGIIELPDASTPSECGFPIIIPPPIDHTFSFVPKSGPQRICELKTVDEDVNEANCPENSPKSPVKTPPNAIPIKTTRLKLKTPPKPRPVCASSPRSPSRPSLMSTVLSPPVREMYSHPMPDNEFLFNSISSRSSSDEVKKSPIPVGKEATESRPLDSSDELKAYEFDHLADGSNSSVNKSGKLETLENIELFCLCISLAIIRRERDIILSRKYDSCAILKHFNTLHLNDCLNNILLHSMTIWHWLKHDGGEKSLYNDDEFKPSNTSVDDFDLLNDDDEVDCQNFAALAV